jgi:hypothetical protein
VAQGFTSPTRVDRADLSFGGIAGPGTARILDDTNAPFRGLGTTKNPARGAGGKSREARKLADAHKAALVRRNG